MVHQTVIYPSAKQPILLVCLRGSYDITIKNDSDCYLVLDENTGIKIELGPKQQLTLGGCPLNSSWQLRNTHEEPAEVNLTYTNNSVEENLSPRKSKKPRRNDQDDDLSFIYKTRKNQKCKT